MSAAPSPAPSSPPNGDELSSIVLEQADRVFRSEATSERMVLADRGEWPSEIWDAVQHAGLPLALVAEAHGGAGLPAADAWRLVGRAGYYTLPVPLAETMIAGALWTQAGGEAFDAPASVAPVRSHDVIRVEPVAGGFVLNGRAERIPWCATVDCVVVHGFDAKGAAYLARVPAERMRTHPGRNLANEPRDTLVLDGVDLPSEAVRPAPKDCEEGWLALGACLRAQQMTGAMERCLDYAIAYAMERRQFGRPIGKFQAVQHMLAEAAGEYAAAAAGAELARQAYGSADFAFFAAVAKARTGEAAGKVAEVCHQVHGAMGFTHEHPLHFATRRLWSWRDEFGHEAFWQERIGRMVCETGGEQLWSRLIGD